MGILPALIGTMTTVIAYTLLFAGVYKLFAIASDVAELKDLMKERKRARDARVAARDGDRFAAMATTGCGPPSGD